MNNADFLTELNEVLQSETPLTNDLLLENIEEWDSMSALGVMSLFDMEFGMLVNADQLSAAKTIQDLIDLAGDNVIN